jgi:hypothetical protein
VVVCYIFPLFWYIVSWKIWHPWSSHSFFPLPILCIAHNLFTKMFFPFI